MIEKRGPFRQSEPLAKLRGSILDLPAEKSQDAILSHPEAPFLVRSMSEQDLFLLVQEIGPEDALPLLALASNEQWRYFLDMELWDRDRIRWEDARRWIELLHRAHPRRLVKWLTREDPEFTELWLSQQLSIRTLEEDQDPSELPEGFFTLDGVFYLGPVEKPAGPDEEAAASGLSPPEFVRELVEQIAATDHLFYQKLLLETEHILSAEAEEEAYRQRNVRLAEKGFLPFDEAVGIYQPLAPETLRQRPRKAPVAPGLQGGRTSTPQYPLRLADRQSPFSMCLELPDQDALLEQIQGEFAGLCNQVIAADQKRVKGKEGLGAVVRKCCGYLSIGLERLAPGSPGEAAALVRRYALSDIFRVGYAAVLELKWEAEKWHERAWFVLRRLALHFWAEEWLGVLGGLLLKKPQYFDNYRTGELYRDFRRLDEVRATRQVLTRIMAVDDLLSCLPVDPGYFVYRFMTYRSLLLTLWAKHALELPQDGQALGLDQLRAFFQMLWVGGARPRLVRKSMKQAFLSWVARASGRKPRQITEELGETLEELFRELESEYGAVDTNDLDPRYVHLFLVS